MTTAIFWIIGGAGFLGSHLRGALLQRVPNACFWYSTPANLSWNNPKKLREELSCAVAAFGEAVRMYGVPWGVIWCAGTGVVTSAAADLDPEWTAWAQMLDSVGKHLGEANHHAPGVIFLASSAGGVYGGSIASVLTEHSQPQPVSHYGRHKLRMEQALRSWAITAPDVSCLVGRISSLYGPGQNLQKAQGIISHLSRCLIYRYPISIYVPLDTRRDYLFINDCAHEVAASLVRLMTERPRELVIKVFASEELTSISRIVGTFVRIAKQRPLIVSPRKLSSTQPPPLKLYSDVWRSMNRVRKTDLAAGIRVVHEYQLSLFRRGLLMRPSAPT